MRTTTPIPPSCISTIRIECPTLVSSVLISMVLKPVTLKALVDKNNESITDKFPVFDTGSRYRQANTMTKPMYKKKICLNEWIDDLLCGIKNLRFFEIIRSFILFDNIS